MSHPPPRPTSGAVSSSNNARAVEGGRSLRKAKAFEAALTSESTETDPLLPPASVTPGFVVGDGTCRVHTESHQTSLRARRSTSKSPPVNPYFQHPQQQQHGGESPMDKGTESRDTQSENERTYHSTDTTDFSAKSQLSSLEDATYATSVSSGDPAVRPLPRQGGSHRPTTNAPRPNNNRNLPLLEIPEEVYAVRTSALQVLKPLTASWVVVSVGFSLTVLFGMARWTRLLPRLPFWFILLPAWLSHVALFWCHVRSASALSAFITEANESRQRQDSRDHLDRTEYLPLLQRSLKVGLKTGLLSFFIFVFEILLYIRIARGSVSFTVVLIPIWLLVTVGIIDGIVCRTQNFVRVLCWMLLFAGMVLTVMKVDYGYEHLRWRIVVSPFVAVLSLASAMLIYIIYGHQVGYYRLTESQLTAGNLYSLAALICIVLVVVIGELLPLSRPIEIGTKLFVVVMAPMAVALASMGAWVISQDEFGRLLLYGGQSAVHPMKLRWESSGWTSVQSKGVTIIPMFGEVSFRPLEKQANSIEMCRCCSCYPYEEDDEETFQYMETLGAHAYLAAASNRPSSRPYTAPTGL